MYPIAVLISDVHYSIHTMGIADKAMRMAISKANELGVPLVVCGDLHDTKANLRGECVKAMMDTLQTCMMEPYVLRGNHDAINEKSKEHSLEFLREIAVVVTEPGPYDVSLDSGDFYLGHLIPYHHEPKELTEYLNTIPKKSRLILHQGVTNSISGQYEQDKSALSRDCFKDFRAISGHYHARQDIKCGPMLKNNVGLFSYVGNPYTLTFSEASDPPKGFQILHSDGSLGFVPTNLRRHVVHEADGTLLSAIAAPKLRSDDLLWIRIRDTREKLSKLSKSSIGAHLSVFNDFSVEFRLDLIPTDLHHTVVDTKDKPQEQLLDSLIDDWHGMDDKQKTRVKNLWRST